MVFAHLDGFVRDLNELRRQSEGYCNRLADALNTIDILRSELAARDALLHDKCESNKRLRKIRNAAEQVCRYVDAQNLAAGDPLLIQAVRNWSEMKSKRFAEDYQDAIGKTLHESCQDGASGINMPEGTGEYKAFEQILDLFKGFAGGNGDDALAEITAFIVLRMADMPEAQNDITQAELKQYKKELTEYSEQEIMPFTDPTDAYNNLRKLPTPWEKPELEKPYQRPTVQRGYASQEVITEYQAPTPCEGKTGTQWYLDNQEAEAPNPKPNTSTGAEAPCTPEDVTADTGERIDNEVDGR